MSRTDAASAKMLAYDRASGALDGATAADRIVVAALQAGSFLTRPFAHRGYGLGCRAVATVASKRDIVVQLNPDARFAMPLADPYWSRLLNRGYDYEEEIETLLRAAKGLGYTLVDGGANFGYWSVLATSKPFGSQTAVAIEASPANAIRLRANARLNGDRFTCLNAAIGAASAGYATIVGRKHESLAAVPTEHAGPAQVRMVSIDRLVEDGLVSNDRPCVLKLDVEGLEIEALNGARGLLGGDTVAICEDHGADRSHAVTRHIIENTPLQPFMFDPERRRFRAIRSPSELDRLKRFSWVGYNVFATSSDLWKATIVSAT